MHREGRLVKRAIFLATAALLAMLILAPMAMGQETTVFGGTACAACGGGGGIPSGGSPAALPPSGGSAFLLPMAALLLGSGILTYAVLRRR
jgi:hypothetical protein